MTDDAPLVAAVNHLIKADNYSLLTMGMTRAVENPRLPFTGDPPCLEAMVDLGRADRNAFERLLTLIEEKRQEDPKTAKKDYQRDLMRERRQRMAKAILLHEARSGPLKGDARAKEMASIRERWTRAKAQFIVDKDASSGTERVQATRDFWAMVDRQLDANIANLRRMQAVA